VSWKGRHAEGSKIGQRIYRGVSTGIIGSFLVVSQSTIQNKETPSMAANAVVRVGRLNEYRGNLDVDNRQRYGKSPKKKCVAPT